MPRKREESPYEKIVRRCEQAQAETIQLAEELVQTLKEQPRDPVWERNWFGLVERWESAETVHAALTLCLEIIRDQDPMTMQNLSRQLRHWRRMHGHTNLGWLEMRRINGAGPYLYYRYREPGCITHTHRESYIIDPTASLIAETGIAVLKVAAVRWISETGPRAQSQLLRESLDELKVILGPWESKDRKTA